MPSPEDFLSEHGHTVTHPPANGHANGNGHGSVPSVDPDLSVLRDGRLQAPSLPLDCFPNWGDTFQAIADAANAPVDYVVASALSGASGNIGNSRCVKAWEGWSEPAVLWFGANGDPSSGKSPGSDVVLGALREIEAAEFRDFTPELEAYEMKLQRALAAEALWKEEMRTATKTGAEPPMLPDAAAKPVKPQRPRCIVNDSTPEALLETYSGNPRGVLVYRDELAGLMESFQRYNTSARGMYLEGYGGRPYSIDRKHGGTIVIDRLSLALFGTMQPDRFSTLIAKGDDDGFSSRILWVWPEIRPFARPSQRPDARRVCVALKRLRDIPMVQTERGPEPAYVALDDDAAAMLADWCARQSQTFHGGRLFKSWRGKGRGHVLRLSLVMSYLEWAFDGEGTPPVSVTVEALTNAIKLYDGYFTPMALRVFGDAASPERERDAGAIARWIVATRPAHINARDLYRDRIGGISDPDRAKQAIGVLCEAGWLAEAERKKDARGRKPGDYTVNFRLWLAMAGKRESHSVTNSKMDKTAEMNGAGNPEAVHSVHSVHSAQVSESQSPADPAPNGANGTIGTSSAVREGERIGNSVHFAGHPKASEPASPTPEQIRLGRERLRQQAINSHSEGTA